MFIMEINMSFFDVIIMCFVMKFGKEFVIIRILFVNSIRFFWFVF